MNLGRADRAHELADFDELYQAQCGRVLAMAYALTGDAAEAQDLTQEAFCRAWQRWPRLSRYDDPLAWIRRVVANLVTSRWRRLAVARIHQHRHLPGHMPPLEPDHVALVAAMRTLPAQQRHAIVLHYDEHWTGDNAGHALHRLRDTITAGAVASPTVALRTHASRWLRARRATAGGMVVVAIGAIALGSTAVWQPTASPPVSPARTPPSSECPAPVAGAGRFRIWHVTCLNAPEAGRRRSRSTGSHDGASGPP